MARSDITPEGDQPNNSRRRPGPWPAPQRAVDDTAPDPAALPPYLPSIHAVDAPSGALSATCAAISRTRSAFVKGDHP